MVGDQKSLEKLRSDLVRACRRAYWRGLTAGTWGNASARLPGEGSGSLILIKRTRVSFVDARPADFLVVDGEGRVVEGEGSPSIEVKFHLAIYRCRPGVGVVLHGHAPYALAARGVPLVGAEAGPGSVPVVPYAPPGSAELAEMVGRAFCDPVVNAVLLEHHGFVTVGCDAYQAFYLADMLEQNAKMMVTEQLLRHRSG